MRITIQETNTRKNIAAEILPAIKKDMPLKKEGWNFNWRQLYQDEKGAFYKLILIGKNSQIQGVLKLQLENKSMLVMKDIEIAPHNFGSKGKYEKVAGCLIAFACKRSFEIGKGNYKGFLVFESKTKLIPLYQKKYGATIAIGQKMFIDEITGRHLIEKYLT